MPAEDHVSVWIRELNIGGARTHFSVAKRETQIYKKLEVVFRSFHEISQSGAVSLCCRPSRSVPFARFPDLMHGTLAKTQILLHVINFSIYKC